MAARYKILIILLFITSYSFSQDAKRSIEAIRVNESLKIDGILDEACWANVPVADDFTSFEPYNDGREASQKTEVKVIYDNNAIYIGAMMYDTAPDSIFREFSERDNGDGNTDIFAISIQPFNDGINGVSFWLTAAGVQVDWKINEEDMDESWDAVWESNVKILDNGWSAEIRIPYSALRFPKIPVQEWGINFWRSIRRYREWSSWQFVDKKKGLVTPQVGLLTGVKDIEPPLRLSLSPYVSAYAQNSSDESAWGFTYNGGMDLKYGINESFTLDMTLIPDFGQVQSDEVILNLSPFETYYNEKRSFFTEGTELFDKCEIFYSRRVGNEPMGYEDIYEKLKANEVINENPEETKLINATKLSGRTNKGLGIGVFNAMTSNTNATIEDTLSGKTRKESTQPFTNYNMMVFDQSLKNNSYISLANTNVLMAKDNYTANVTGTEFGILNKENTYEIYGTGVVSQLMYSDENENEYGYTYELGFEKISGNFTFDLNRTVISDTYNPNDMGFLEYNNEVENELALSYEVYDPFWKILSTENGFSINQINLYEPNKFAYLSFSLRSMTLFKNHLTMFINSEGMPMEGNDFYEARNGDVFKMPAYSHTNIFLSPDYRKKFLIDLGAGYGSMAKLQNMQARTLYDITIQPRLRISNRMIIQYRFNYNHANIDYGYVTESILWEDPTLYINNTNKTIFGERELQTITNTLTTGYIFNNKSSLSFKLRYYWSTAEYKRFFELNNEGYLETSLYTGNHDINFNAFTIDMSYKWQFSPGSEMSIVWKNSIYTIGDEILQNYRHNLKNTFDSPQVNSISVKFLYYLDYQSLRKSH